MRGLTILPPFGVGLAQGYMTPGITLLYHCHNPYDDSMSKDKDFESYPTRSITIEDSVWDKLKTAKLKSQKTWTNFLKDLLSNYK